MRLKYCCGDNFEKNKHDLCAKTCFASHIVDAAFRFQSLIYQCFEYLLKFYPYKMPMCAKEILSVTRKWVFLAKYLGKM